MVLDVASPAEAIMLRLHMREWLAALVPVIESPRALRPSQQTPPGDWVTWLLLGGRGMGKTLAGAEDVKRYGIEHPGSRIAIVAPTYADARDTCVEGESGLLGCLPPSLVANWNRSMGELILTNGTRYKLFSADEPERLRGPQHHRAWCDELGAWKRPETWDMLMFGLRLGANPQVVGTTTPRPTKLVRMLAEASTTYLTRGTTYENLENLPAAFAEQIIKRYEGTRLGRQELLAEILTDVPGALWTYALLEDRKPAPDLLRCVVGVDPSGGSDPENDEQGIIVGGKGIDGHGYVVADRSCRLSPDGWGRRAVQAYVDFKADAIVVERNFGGDMAKSVVTSAARAMGVTVDVIMVTASRGKALRAQPVAALYEQGLMHHVEVFAELEEQCTTWTPESGTSPDRLDALVWMITETMLGDEGEASFF